MRCDRQSTSQSQLRTTNIRTTNIQVANIQLANHYPSKNRKLAKFHLPHLRWNHLLHLIWHHLWKLQVSDLPLRAKTSTTIIRWQIFR